MFLVKLEAYRDKKITFDASVKVSVAESSITRCESRLPDCNCPENLLSTLSVKMLSEP